MTTHGADNLDRRACRVAALFATALLVGTGLGYRAVAARLVDWAAIAPFSPGTLAQLPLQIGDWTGRDQPLDERVIEVVDADDHISRLYTRGGRKAVSLFLALRRRDVAYGVPARELMPHRPEVCYPAHGWMPVGSDTAQVETADGSRLGAQILRFQRGDLDVQRVTVLTYYIVDGRRARSPVELRPSGWRPKGNVRYIAQVEIASTGDLLGLSAEGLVRAFAGESAPDIMTLVTRAVERTHGRITNPAN